MSRFIKSPSSLLIFIFFTLLYTSTQTSTIYGGDGGDLVTAAYLGGVAHPPGYPLYTALGYIIGHLTPFGTVAWRLSLLSSLPLAGGLTLLHIYLERVTKKIAASFVATLIIGTSYIYWLYAIVPEVFGLHIFLMSSQLLALHMWTTTKKTLYASVFVCVFVLSLSHHHIILFLTPFYAAILLQERASVRSLIHRDLKKLAGAAFIGMLPVLYYLFAIKHLALYTWEDQLSVSTLIRLVTRSAYGSFAAASVTVEKPLSRLTDIYAYFLIVAQDITIPGFFIACIGAFYQFLKKRKNFYLFATGFVLTGPGYIFYAAYVLSNSFTIATFERFLMPSYIFLAVWIAEGISYLLDLLKNFMHYVRQKTQSSLTLSYTPIFIVLFTLIPVNLLFINYPKMRVLKNDFTAERHAQNMLNSVDKNAILLLTKDNEIFNVAYENKVRKYRSDVVVINQSRLFDGRRFLNIKKHYPDIIFPPRNDKGFEQKFVKMNAEKRSMYTADLFDPGKDYVWARIGLVYKLYKKDALPPEKDLLARNNALWDGYFNPLSGSLGQYKHLMLASNLIVYRMYRLETGDYFFVAKDYAGAEKHYRAALAYDNSDVKVYLRLAAAQMEQKKCEAAEKTLDQAYAQFPDVADIPSMFTKLYTNCFKDDKKVNAWKKVYDALHKKSQQALQQL